MDFFIVFACNVLELAFSPSTLQHFQNIGEFGAKEDFTDHQTANTIHLFLGIKGNFSEQFFSEQIAAKGIPYSYLFICISLKKTLNSGQKPV